jgi:NAD+ synthase (glutamine-hydrolysing)
MKHGFLKVACATPKIKVADCSYNVNEMINIAKDASEKHVKVLVFPELCITAYTCADMFFSNVLLDGAHKALKKYIKETRELDMLSVVGLPMFYENKIYNCAAVVKSGELLGVVAKSNLPTYGEFYEGRYFVPCPDENFSYLFEGKEVPFGRNILFSCRTMPLLKLGIEICEDIWVNTPPSNMLSIAGATLLANLSASNEVVAKDEYRRILVSSQSAKTVSAYIYANCGEGESTTDVVYSGHSIIAENGSIISERIPFDFENEKFISAEVDLEKISLERRRRNTVTTSVDKNIVNVPFDLEIEETTISRNIDHTPFVSSDKNQLIRNIKTIRSIQSYGLKQRLESCGAQKCVVGISGGLDSTLALLSTVHTFKIMKKNLKDIIAVTMPCFGTTERTKNNARALANALGVALKEIDICDAVKCHLESIGHDLSTYDLVYENAQARKRAQILMDIANGEDAIVVGTGDISELALGFTTYGGDHMSMYSLNSGIPKTLVPHILSFYAEDYNGVDGLADVINDIIDTPISPELIPANNGQISQITEDIVGPYELHDFFLYYMLTYHYSPEKLFRIAQIAFEGRYEKELILSCLRVFIKRFFSQQFKRSCIPDGPKAFGISLSPRGDLKMPSDVSSAEWLKLVDEINL